MRLRNYGMHWFILVFTHPFNDSLHSSSHFVHRYIHVLFIQSSACVHAFIRRYSSLFRSDYMLIHLTITFFVRWIIRSSIYTFVPFIHHIVIMNVEESTLQSYRDADAIYICVAILTVTTHMSFQVSATYCSGCLDYSSTIIITSSVFLSFKFSSLCLYDLCNE